ncbi:MAG: hypothetical protein JXQ76_12785, partial [Campylobacterales bacterium]|nr:hypothetical protein [Campylobacterales bacterium]
MKMKWKNNKNLKPEVILKKIDSIEKTINEDGSITRSVFNFDFEYSINALYFMVEFPKQFTDIENRSLLEEAININMKLNSPLDKAKVLDELQNLAQQKMTKKEDEYHILTSVSLGNPLLLTSIKVGNSEIKFLESSFPEKYQSRYKINETRIKQLEPSQYTKIIISTKAKSTSGAINQALNDFDLLRAMFSLLVNSTRVLTIFGNQHNTLDIPINKVRLGECHTIHNDLGENINPDQYWYEPNYTEAKLYIFNNLERDEKNIRQMIIHLHKCRYSKKLENALLRYVRAFDQKDLHIAFLEAWGALESLTAYEDSSKANLPKRCAFLYKEYEYHRQILEYLREYRNQSVHAGICNEEVKSSCYQLQEYFYTLIKFHLRNVDIFST